MQTIISAALTALLLAGCASHPAINQDKSLSPFFEKSGFCEKTPDGKKRALPKITKDSPGDMQYVGQLTEELCKVELLRDEFTKNKGQEFCGTLPPEELLSDCFLRTVNKIHAHEPFSATGLVMILSTQQNLDSRDLLTKKPGQNMDESSKRDHLERMLASILSVQAMYKTRAKPRDWISKNFAEVEKATAKSDQEACERMVAFAKKGQESWKKLHPAEAKEKDMQKKISSMNCS